MKSFQLEGDTEVRSIHKSLRSQARQLLNGADLDTDELVDQALAINDPSCKREARKIVRSLRLLERGLFEKRQYESCIALLERLVDVAREYELTKMQLQGTQFLIRALCAVDDYPDALRYAREGAEVSEKHGVKHANQKFKLLADEIERRSAPLADVETMFVEPARSYTGTRAIVARESPRAWNTGLLAPIDRKLVNKKAAHISTLLKKQ